MSLIFGNRQRVCILNLRLLRKIVEWILKSDREASYPGPLPQGGRGRQLGSTGSVGELGIYFVTAEEIAQINADFLRHTGPTDVITFDYGEDGAEIFVCPEVAMSQARQFRTSWQEELMRYVIHGILHLRGYDDRTAKARREMKREENRLVSAALKEFSAVRIGKLR